MIIAVPTGVKVFNWPFILYRGRLRISAPLLWVWGSSPPSPSAA
jgi:heme/copper-type cytochrome/quinol oxidase subunit 1